MRVVTAPVPADVPTLPPVGPDTVAGHLVELHAVPPVVLAGVDVEEVLGSFLTTRSFTRLVEWFGVPIEVLQGAWTPRQLAAARPDLIPARGAASKKK